MTSRSPTAPETSRSPTAPESSPAELALLIESGEPVQIMDVLAPERAARGRIDLVEDRVALTGDFLLVESIGRPDLGGKEESWAGQLWDSVVGAIAEWDAGIAVYPAHYASPSERKMGQAVGISFGDLLAGNPVLRIPDREGFIHFILENRTSFPDAYRTIKALNVGLAPIVHREVEKLEVGRNECALGGV